MAFLIMIEATFEMEVLNSESVFSGCSGIATQKLFLKQLIFSSLIWMKLLKPSSAFSLTLYETDKLKWVKTKKRATLIYI